ncbi:Hypothetical predicted protein [Mytilus galloprovincialis]|uniref:Reverse transcriptase domain-containing protein n=1 Tax=Mytilus galloprovincialis TaxID=29158 RepID=A0A8B6HRZ4_MYTGA|nr:Hypothetical predicted protein [Mytilus galloprovincialis]
MNGTWHIVSLFRKGHKSTAANYRPVSLTAISSKVMEHILHSKIMEHLEEHSILTPAQHGFRTKRSFETHLIATIRTPARRICLGVNTLTKPQPKHPDLLEFCTTLVRPVIDYTSTVWDPYQHQQIQQQICKGNFFSMEPNCVTKMTQQLGREPLEHRRARDRVNMFYKIISYIVEVPVHHLLILHNTRTRGSMSNNIRQIRIQQDCFKYSFIPATIISWNNIPQTSELPVCGTFSTRYPRCPRVDTILNLNYSTLFNCTCLKEFNCSHTLEYIHSKMSPLLDEQIDR